jgi:hypothetical protein
VTQISIHGAGGKAKYDLVTRRNIIQHLKGYSKGKKKGNATTWMNLKDIMLSVTKRHILVDATYLGCS